MTALMALVRKQMVESRWLLGLSAAAMFGLSWLFVYACNRIERKDREGGEPTIYVRRGMIAQRMGGEAADNSSTALEIAFWRHPFVILIAALWPIARGSASVAGELERGSLDMVLSRPVSRTAYLTAQVLTGLIGLAVLAAALIAGNLVGNRLNFIEVRPAPMSVLRPGLNVAALGLAIFGYTVFLSSIDIVRWRPNLIASVLTLAMFIAGVVANLPGLDDWKWLEKVSIFTAFDPVEAAVRASRLGFHLALLSGIGLAGMALGYVSFNRRDLPANA